MIFDLKTLMLTGKMTYAKTKIFSKPKQGPQVVGHKGTGRNKLDLFRHYSDGSRELIVKAVSEKVMKMQDSIFKEFF